MYLFRIYISSTVNKSTTTYSKYQLLVKTRSGINVNEKNESFLFLFIRIFFYFGSCFCSSRKFTSNRIAAHKLNILCADTERDWSGIGLKVYSMSSTKYLAEWEKKQANKKNYL